MDRACDMPELRGEASTEHGLLDAPWLHLTSSRSDRRRHRRGQLLEPGHLLGICGRRNCPGSDLRRLNVAQHAVHHAPQMTHNNTLERTVKQRGRAVLATNGVLGG